MGKHEQQNKKNRIGEIAEADDIAPQGTKITQEHVQAHEETMREAHENLNLPTENL